MFLGNGDMGAMFWGRGAPFKVTLDKMDFWEERCAPEGQFGESHTWEDMKRLVKSGDFLGLREKYEFYMGGSGDDAMPLQPTRLPVPRLEIAFRESFSGIDAELDIEHGIISGYLYTGNPGPREPDTVEFRGFLDATKNLLILEFRAINFLKGFIPSSLNSSPVIDPLCIPVVSASYAHLDNRALRTLKAWDYPSLIPIQGPIPGVHDAIYQGVYQEVPGNQGGLLVAWMVIEVDGWVRIGCTVLSAGNLPRENLEAGRLLESLEHEARKILTRGSTDSWTSIIKHHEAFWNEYWSKARISIPDNILENLYYVELYKLACNSRQGSPPCSLQGIWTIDGQMPPWNGDYHLDMNIQETYWPVFVNNRLSLVEPLFSMMDDLVPIFRKRCKEFYGCDGIWTSCSISLRGANLHGYYNTEAWPGNGAWTAHMYWLYYLYTRDEKFLAESAFPFMKGVMQLYEHVLERNKHGEWHVPLSSSPEYHEHHLQAWGSNPTCDIALIRWLLEALLESASILAGKSGDGGASGNSVDDGEIGSNTTRWKEYLEDLVYFPADMEGFQVLEGVPYGYSHRHMTHLFPIHPFHLITIEGDRDDQYLVTSSLKHLRKIGNWEWVGWTLPWLSMMASWINNRWLAAKYARDYLLYINENTMHVNGDPRGIGICTHVYEPMTLEAGFTFAAAIPELLLKSWGGIIRLFESCPASWHDACFENLRAEGAFLVSAALSNGHVAWVKVQSEKGIPCTIKNTFGEPMVVRNSSSFGKVCIIEGNEELFTFETVPGETYTILPAREDPGTINFDFHHVPPLFNGRAWFGKQACNRNPYLP
ncbi:hypothetical protein GF325_03215 [Candidatus Bathyarchaeota archaeon]|nr:hypothetical protein [Candidatus Bathyarchaeota archaeon]